MRRASATDLVFRVRGAGDFNLWEIPGEEFLIDVSPGESLESGRVTCRDGIPFGDAERRFLQLTVVLLNSD